MTTKDGRAPSGQALAVPATPANAVDGPSGFDPSRYGLTCAMVTLRMEQLMDDSLFQIVERLCALEREVVRLRNLNSRRTNR